MNRKIQRTALVCATAVAMLMIAGAVAASDDQGWAEKEYKKAVKDANYGFDELDIMGNDLAKEKPKKAMDHFEIAIEFFDHALTHLAKAEVGKEHKGAVDDLNSGNEALNKALKSLDAGKVEDAQKYFDKANEYFTSAQSALN